jgi:hypothetical protein
MGPFLLITFLCLPAIIFTSIYFSNRKKKKELIDHFKISDVNWSVNFSYNGKSLLAINSVAQKLAVGDFENYHTIDFKDLVSVEIEKNGEALVNTSRSSQAAGAAVGAVLLGPIGLLIGGLSGSKRSAQMINSLGIKITAMNNDAPVHRFLFFKISGSGVKLDGPIIAPHIKKIENLHAIIFNAIKSSSAADAILLEKKPLDTDRVEDRLAKLWSLHREGALSLDEYNSAKASMIV